jgi:hypothetical protein
MAHVREGNCRWAEPPAVCAVARVVTEEPTALMFPVTVRSAPQLPVTFNRRGNAVPFGSLGLARTTRRTGARPAFWRAPDSPQEGSYSAPSFLHFSHGYQQLTGVRRPWLLNLHAVAVQDLPLDLGSLDRLLADEVDLQGLLVFGADMPVGADELARLPQEVLLQSSDLAAGYQRGESPYAIERSRQMGRRHFDSAESPFLRG